MSCSWTEIMCRSWNFLRHEDQTSRLNTQPKTMWSKVSGDWSQKMHRLSSWSPWRHLLSVVQHLLCKTSQKKSNYTISFCFHLYLMLHACVVRFDVTKNLEKFLVFLWELNKANIPSPRGRARLHLATFLGHSQPPQTNTTPQTNTSLFCTLCPHSCASGNYFPVGHPSINCSRPSTLNFRVLSR